MAKLYVANTTKQAHDFAFRVPAEDDFARRVPRLSTIRIEAGSQQQIMGEVSPAQINAVVEQYLPYGLIPVDEVPSTRAFIGLCYSIDKPVDIERLTYALDHNQGVLFDRGKVQQKETAVATGNALEEMLRQPMREMEIEVLEEADAPKLATGLRVVRS